MLDEKQFFENLTKVRKRILLACQRTGREPREITMVAVTKNVSTPIIALAYQAGLRIFGENRIQEASAKIPTLASDTKWHLVGHLQKNKINKALELAFDFIESLDSLDLALKLNRHLASLKKTQKVLLEVNIAQEEQKHGFAPEELSLVLPQILGCENLHVLGLMTMGPNLVDANQMRPYFTKARMIFEELKIKNSKFRILSMGMSKDFDVAIEEGATMIRVGQALFGQQG